MRALQNEARDYRTYFQTRNQFLRTFFLGARPWKCQIKDHQQYDNFAGQYGERFLEGFTLAGHQVIDMWENQMLP